MPDAPEKPDVTPAPPAADAPEGTTPAAPANGPEGGAPAPSPKDVPGKPQDPAPKTTDGGDGDGDNPNRREARYRTERNTARQERDDALAKVADLDAVTAERDQFKTFAEGVQKLLDPNAGKDTPPPTVEELSAKFEAERNGWTSERDTLAAENRALRVTTVLPDLFRDAKVDPKLTTAVLTATGELRKLDPDADGFLDAAKAAIAKAAEDNPGLLVKDPAPTPTPRRSGSSEPTGNTARSQLTLDQYRALPLAERVKAQREGRTRNLAGAS